ncbi:MAG: response regulator [Candidatus Cloacimonetes bacterium]|nr:response regulator [Candidatus Cloacimonadota bacterium]
MNEQKVLIIDDEIMNHDFIKNALSDLDYDIISSLNADDGLMLFQIHKPQVVILDLVMPGKDGIELLERLEPEPDSHFAVIIISAFGTDEEVKKCYELNASAFLPKPLSKVTFNSLVRSLMQSVIYKIELDIVKSKFEDLNRKHR